MRIHYLAIAPAALLVLAACGGSDLSGPEDVTCNSFLLQYGAAPSDTVFASQGLKYIDVVTGTGADAALTNTVDVNYSGYLASNNNKFDSSCDAGTPTLRLTLGSGSVIAGFDLGIRGMKPGGVRRVIIPPELGYGAVPRQGIPANSTLIFDIQYVGLVD
jgi:FKBP-type peptidyl-prolyl cis-trans isomerase FkpA